MRCLRRRSTEVWPLITIAAVVVLANLPSLLGLFDTNPLGPRSELAHSVSGALFPGQNTIDVSDGWISQALGHRAALDLLHLRMPWWNPYEATGTPLAAEMGSASLFPPTLLTALSDGQLFERILLELLAGASTYLLVRRLGMARVAGVAAGVAFALNGTFSWLANGIVNPVAFLPMLLLGIEMAYGASTTGRRGGWWLIAVAGALSFYAGFPEVTYLNALFGVAWAGWRCASLGRARLRPFLGKSAAGVVVAALLAGPLLVGFVGYLGHSELGPHSAGSLYGSRHSDWIALPQLVLPYVYGPINSYSDPLGRVSDMWSTVGGYLGVSLVFLALLGLLSEGRRGLKLLLGGWVVLTTARMYGVPVVGDVLGLIPGMARVMFYRYAFTSLELAVIVLAAVGLDGLTKRLPSVRRTVRTTLLSMLVVAAAAAGSRLYGAAGYYRTSTIVALAIVLIAALLTRESRAGRRTRGLAVLVAAEAVALFVVPQLTAPRRVPLDLGPVAYLRHHLGQSRFFTLGPIHANYGAYYGLASLNVSDIPVPAVFARQVRSRLDPYTDPLNFYGYNTRRLVVPSPAQELLRNVDAYRAAAVAYVLTPRRMRFPKRRTGFTEVLRTPTARIYRLAGAAPYFTAQGRGCATSSSGRAHTRVTCSAPTVVVRRETDFPGWTAQIDGRSTPIRRYQGIYQSVTVPAGTHRVSFTYAPVGVIWGYLAFAAGCLALVVSATRRSRA